MISTGEEVEVRTYKRLTELIVEDKAVESLNKVQPGDCIVCFSKQVRKKCSNFRRVFLSLVAISQC